MRRQKLTNDVLTNIKMSKDLKEVKELEMTDDSSINYMNIYKSTDELPKQSNNNNNNLNFIKIDKLIKKVSNGGGSATQQTIIHQ